MVSSGFPLVRVVKFLGKVQFTMILLLLGMIVMTVGTVVESRQSRDLAQSLIYGAFWFDVLLFLIAVNLVMAVVNRIPIKRRQWPVVFTHLAIVVLLLGCWISHTFGYEGRMMIFEGDEENRIVLDATEIRARWYREADTPAPLTQEAVVSEATFSLPFGQRIGPRELQREAEARPGLRVLDYVAHGVAGLALRDAGREGGAPGIEFALRGPNFHAREWIMADGRSARRKRVGPVDIEFLVTRAEQAFEFLAAPAPAPAQDYSSATLLIQPRRGGEPARISLPENVGREIPCEAGVVARVERFLLRARLVDGELVDVPRAGLNPAAIVVVESGGQSERHTVFARFPDFHAMHGRTKGAELVGELRLEAPRLDARALITVILGPGDRLHAQLTTPGGQRTEAEPLVVGERVALAGLGLAFELERFFERARPEIVVAPASERQEGANAYIRLAANFGEDRESFWLGQGSSEELSLGPHVLEVAFARQTRLLPFALALQDFEIVYHPGSQRPAEYRSKARLKPADDARAPRDVVISMNRPLDEGGWRFFQSSYRLGHRGRPDATILSVSYDPGVPVVYGSFALIVLGIAWYVREQRQGLKSAARETSRLLDLEGFPSDSSVDAAQTAA